MDVAISNHFPFSLGKQKNVIFIISIICYMYHGRESPVTVEALQTEVSATYTNIYSYLILPILNGTGHFCLSHLKLFWLLGLCL